MSPIQPSDILRQGTFSLSGLVSYTKNVSTLILTYPLQYAVHHHHFPVSRVFEQACQGSYQTHTHNKWHLMQAGQSA